MDFLLLSRWNGLVQKNLMEKPLSKCLNRITRNCGNFSHTSEKLQPGRFSLFISERMEL